MVHALRWSLVVVAVLLGLSPALAQPRPASAAAPVIQASGLRIEMTASPGALWTVAPGSRAPSQAFAPPVFPLDGRLVVALPERFERQGEPIPLGPDVLEHRFRGVLRDDPSLALEVRFRLADLSPIVRFQYRLSATKPHAFSRSGAQDEIVYLATDLAGLPRATEVRLSEFVELFHSFTPSERSLDERHFDAGLGVMGPILIGSDGRRTLLLAYEHGSQTPDAFVRFDLAPGRRVTLRAVKGSYWNGQLVDAEHPYDGLWLQVGLIAGDERHTAEAYRRFVRDEMSANAATRQPRIHYNTWTLPRAQQVAKRQAYLDSMNEQRMLAEIDVAHRMGIDVVRARHRLVREDGGLAVSRQRFPRGLGPAQDRLEDHGMRLGLWFDPMAPPYRAGSTRERADACTWQDEPDPARCGRPRRAPDVSRLALGDAFAESWSGGPRERRHLLQVGRRRTVRLRRPEHGTVHPSNSPPSGRMRTPSGSGCG